MKTSLNITFEKAVHFLVKYLPISNENTRKSYLFHDIRVGVYLYENWYWEDIVLAWLLHDTIEWSEVNADILRQEFWENILRLVLASTKNDNLIDKNERLNDLINRCINEWQDALIIKTADIIDSFKWYTSQNNIKELEWHCIKNAKLILEFKPVDFNDKIFEELKLHIKNTELFLNEECINNW